MSDEALALAALEAGVTVYYRVDGAFSAVGPTHATLGGVHLSPTAALAAAARALGLQPKWVVVDRETVKEARLPVSNLAEVFEAMYGMTDDTKALLALSSALEGGDWTEPTEEQLRMYSEIVSREPGLHQINPVTNRRAILRQHIQAFETKYSKSFEEVFGGGVPDGPDHHQLASDFIAWGHYRDKLAKLNGLTPEPCPMCGKTYLHCTSDCEGRREAE